MKCKDKCIHHPICERKNYEFANSEECPFYAETKLVGEVKIDLAEMKNGIRLINKESGKVDRSYTCDPKKLVRLCYANIECLLHIALADPDDHITELGGEEHLITLMNKYLDLATDIAKVSTYETMRPLLEERSVTE